MTPTWTIAHACDEFVRCIYCPSLYRSPRRLSRPYVCPVCAQDVDAASRRAR